MIAYVTTQGSRIEREGGRLIVVSPNMRRTLFAAHLEQLLLFGNVGLTAPARYLLLREKIDTVFLRKDGRYMGRLATTDPMNVQLRKKQFILTDNRQFRLKISKKIIAGKILNQATLLSRIKRARKIVQLENAVHLLQIYARKAGRTASIEELRGVEGQAASTYFKNFRHGLLQDWNFTRRLRRPPSDPVNAVLSFLYSLLAARCVAALRQAGLDTQPGIMHEISYSRDALALDLMEEFRPMLADTLTLSLFNMRVLDWGDFAASEPPAQASPEGTGRKSEEEERIDKAAADPLGQISPTPGPEDTVNDDLPEADGEEAIPHVERRPLYLDGRGLKAVLTAWSKKLETEFHHPANSQKMNYSDAIVFQARQLRLAIEGQAEDYVPLMLR